MSPFDINIFMSFPYPYPGPIAPENNPPIEPQFYIPSKFDISAITRGVTTTITTSENHNYVIGQTIRVLIPQPFGTYQISGEQGIVLSIPADDQVTVTINSTNANAFVASPTYAPTPAQIMAIGDVNSGPINSSGRVNQTTFIEGSFINISPL